MSKKTGTLEVTGRGRLLFDDGNDFVSASFAGDARFNGLTPQAAVTLIRAATDQNLPAFLHSEGGTARESQKTGKAIVSETYAVSVPNGGPSIAGFVTRAQWIVKNGAAVSADDSGNVTVDYRR